MNRNYSYKELQNITKYVTEHYKLCVRRMKSLEFQGAQNKCTKEYIDAANYVHEVDLILKDCSKTTQTFIREEFICSDGDEWRVRNYSNTTFYRLRKKAIEEFVGCLNR